MAATRTCPKCGGEMPGGALEGLCPKCIVKVIKPGMDSAEVLARFEAERQARAPSLPNRWSWAKLFTESALQL